MNLAFLHLFSILLISACVFNFCFLLFKTCLSSLFRCIQFALLFHRCSLIGKTFKAMHLRVAVHGIESPWYSLHSNHFHFTLPWSSDNSRLLLVGLFFHFIISVLFLILFVSDRKMWFIKNLIFKHVYGFLCS